MGGPGNRQLENIQYFNGEYAIFYKSLKACSFSKLFQDTNMKDSEKSSVRVHFNFMDVEDAYFNRRSSTGSEVRKLKGEIGKSSAFH